VGDISANFSRHEFSCKCGCGFSVVDAELIKLLELSRIQWGAAVTINSAARCEYHNNFIGGAKNSQHLLGTAADFKVRGVEPKVVYEWLTAQYPKTYGMGLYNSWVHLDVRPVKARWDTT